jgi:hypothetical protein
VKWVDEQPSLALPWLPVSARDHQLLRVAVFQVLGQLSRYRGVDGRARRDHDLRDDPSLVLQVREDYAKRIVLDADSWATGGMSTRYTSRLAVACNIYGVPLTRMAAFWISLCNRTETGSLPLGFLRSYCEA